MYYHLYFQIEKLAPIPKSSAGPTKKSGASLSGKSGGGKSSSFGSNISKNSSNTFGSKEKTSSAIGSTGNSSSTFGSAGKSSKSPIFGGIKPSSGLSPSTSKKTYENVSYAPNRNKSSTFGIIWIPTKKRSKKKDLVYSSINYDKVNEHNRSPSMYPLMSGDSPVLQLHNKKDEETPFLVPERLKEPTTTVARAPPVTITETPYENERADMEEKLLERDNNDSKEAAGDANDNDSYLENKETLPGYPDDKKKTTDKVDSVLPTHQVIKVPPQSTASTPEEDECIIKCLYYTLQCCECVIM